jgi:hypothetical protein
MVRPGAIEERRQYSSQRIQRVIMQALVGEETGLRHNQLFRKTNTSIAVSMRPFRRELNELVKGGYVSREISGEQGHLHKITKSGVVKLTEFETMEFIHECFVGRLPDDVAYTSALIRGIAERALVPRNRPYTLAVNVEPKGESTRRVAIIVGLTDEASLRFLDLPQGRKNAVIRIVQDAVDTSIRTEGPKGRALVNSVVAWDPDLNTYIFAGVLSPRLSQDLKQLVEDNLIEEGEAVVRGATEETIGQYVDSVVNFLKGIGQTRLADGLLPTSIVIVLSQYDPKLKRMVHTYEHSREELRKFLEKIPSEELKGAILKTVS